MRWIDTHHLKLWASSVPAIGRFPSLLQSLVVASASKSAFLDFPDGKQVFEAGVDGYVNSDVASNYVPEGISVWELGTTPGIKKKANEEFIKRADHPNGYDPLKSTFIFITPLTWPGRRKWVEEKNQEKKWKEVRAYDGGMIAAWLDNEEVVARNFAPEISSMPSDEVQTAQDFWYEWSCGPQEIRLNPDIVTAGREYQVEQIKDFLLGDPDIRVVRGASKHEAIAFIIAAAKQFERERQGRFFSKSLIIDNENIFRRISSKKQSLIIISTIEGQVIHRGPLEGNHVFLPLGADDERSIDVIVLPALQGEKMATALTQSGIENEKAKQLVRESGHNITILRKLLDFKVQKSEWAVPLHAREVIPSLLGGKWDDTKDADQHILSQLSGKNYNKYITEISAWKTGEIPFIYNIGAYWRLASPLHAWTALASFITKNDLSLLANAFLEVMKETRPALNLPAKERESSEFLTENRMVHSGSIREGLTQSLIIIAVYGDSLKLPINTTAQTWVDRVVFRLFENADSKLWSTLNYTMPLIAEASPEGFLSAIEQSLNKADSEISAMFEEEPSIITPKSSHAGLLWGLEGLAWMPDYLPRVSLILAHLARIDPGGRLNNRPINSLKHIFSAWFPQTFAEKSERHNVLTLLVEHEPQIAREILISILPPLRGIAFPTHKTRWRLFEIGTSRQLVDKSDRVDTYFFVVRNLLVLSNFDETFLAQLIEHSDEMYIDLREEILEFLRENFYKIRQKKYSIWHALRKMLNRHRSHSQMSVALLESEIDKLDLLYQQFVPSDIIHKNLWLFNENWPGVAYGTDSQLDHIESQRLIDEFRRKALSEINDKFGIDKVFELADSVQEKWAYGHALATLINNDSDRLKFLTENRLADEKNYAVKGFLYHQEIILGLSAFLILFKNLQLLNYNIESLGNFFVPLRQSKTLWDFIDSLNESIKAHYWLKMYPHFYPLSPLEKTYVINKLISADRAKTAIVEGYHSLKELEDKTIVDLLASAVASKEQINLQDYQVQKIFSQLDERGTIDKSIFFQLEWMYLGLISSSYSVRLPLHLYEQLSTDPEFFIEIIKLVYKPSDVDSIDDLEDFSEEKRQAIINKAVHASDLLYSWKKLPGTLANGLIDVDKLKEWVFKARDFAEKEKRKNAADYQIARIFANSSLHPDGHWPQEIIPELIDTINSPSLTQSFRSELFNKYGSSSKAIGEGGDRERDLSKYFKDLATRVKSKWPITASVFQKLAKGYLDDAKLEDQRAERDSLEY